jgi:hypothetical protein
MKTPKPEKLWTLLYNGQNVPNMIGVLYPVLARKKRDLINARTHQEKLFSVKYHKS